MQLDTAALPQPKKPGVSRLIPATLFLLGIAILLRLIFAWTSLTNLPATSDEASVFLQAKMIAHGERPLLCLGQPYLFPTEAYMMAPFVKWLPHNAFGARYQALSLGFLSLFGFLLVIRTAFPKGARWPAELLVLFPSAYLLMLTSAYSPFQYPIAMTLVWLGIYLVLKGRQNGSTLLFLLAGLACGLAWSSHMFTATTSVGVMALALFAGNARRGMKNVLLCGLGFLLGAIPYLLAIWLQPGAYHNIPNSLPLDVTFTRLLFPTLTETYAGAMGFNPPLFPDFKRNLGEPHGFRIFFVACYLLLLGFLIMRRLPVLIREVTNRRWPDLQLVDLALIANILMVCWFAHHNTNNNAYRYLLPAVWCFPFLVGHAFLLCRGRWKMLFGTVAIVLALFDLGTATAMIKEWRTPGRIMKYSDTPPLAALLQNLETQHIHHCYASFWLAYRIPFESDEAVICSMPFSERFGFWPVPYKQQVDEAPDTAYVLTQTFLARLPALTFIQHLKEQEIDCQMDKVSADGIASFLVFHDCNYLSPRLERILQPNEYVSPARCRQRHAGGSGGKKLCSRRCPNNRISVVGSGIYRSAGNNRAIPFRTAGIAQVG